MSGSHVTLSIRTSNTDILRPVLEGLYSPGEAWILHEPKVEFSSVTVRMSFSSDSSRLETGIGLCTLFTSDRDPGLNFTLGLEGAEFDGTNVASQPLGHTELIKRQIALYRPGLVVCCGTDVAVAVDQMYGPSIFRWQRTTRGISYSSFIEGSMLVSAPHPQARVENHILHYAVVDAVREILESTT